MVVPSSGGGARRLKRETLGRQHVVKVRLNDDEERALTLRAAAAGVSRQRFLLEAALLAERRTVPERRATAAEFQALARTLRGIGSNLNQLTMVANASGHVVAGSADAVAAVAALQERLTVAIEGLER